MINSIISSSINMFASKLQFVKDMDQKTLAFIKAYIFKLKSPGLSAYEQRLTRTQIVKSIIRAGGISDSGLSGWAESEMSAHIPGKEFYDYFQHPTAGKVGGFIFTLDMSGDKVIANCYDKWDFNTTEYDIELPIPKVLWSTAKKLASMVGITLYRFTEETEMYTTDCLYISENDLSRFNESHAFETHWQVELPPLSCKLTRWMPTTDDRYSRYVEEFEYSQENDYDDIDYYPNVPADLLAEMDDKPE